MINVTTNMSWQDISKAAQAHRADTIAQVKPSVPEPPSKLPLNVTTLPAKLLSPNVIRITELPVEALLGHMATGKLTSTEVTKAFLQRAGLASKLVNCTTELLPERALHRAAELDNFYGRHGRPTGSLHGLPISVKEHIAMKGLDLNAGFISWVGNVAPDDALILKLLWKAGCVFYVRTTEPQTLMHLETSSNIYGVTVNPYNTNLTSGGSSGGEGALLGMRGSCLGVGTDIGGSIRSPAANQGVFGLRPTSYRLPLDGFAATMLGEEHIVPVVGPLSTSLEGVKIFMKALIDQKPWLYDPMLIPMPWKDSTHGSLLRKSSTKQSRTLRIGILADDQIVKPHPPIQRGMQTLISALQSHPSITLIPFPPHDHATAWQIISSLYFADGAREEKDAIATSSEPLRPLSKFILIENPNVRHLSVSDIWKLTSERDAYRAAYARHWNSIGTDLPGASSAEALEVNALGKESETVDVILCPAGPGCAPPLNSARYWGYTSQWNLLDYPALVFPTGLKCGMQDAVEEGYEARNEDDRFNYELYDPKRYVDAPISLQLVGRRYEDEKVIEALEFITEIAGLPFTQNNGGVEKSRL
ncbi:hypothetical protein Q7P37_007159 [Cladosporium fusiforme]